MIEFLKKLWLRLFPKPVENVEPIALFGDNEHGFIEPIESLSGGAFALKDSFTLPGDTVKNMLSRVGTVKKSRAKLVIVSIGSHSIASGVPANEIVDGLASIGREIEAMAKVPVFMTIPPHIFDDKNKAKTMQSVNDWLKGRGKRGWKVADIHKALITDVHIKDGALNKAGSNIAAKIILEALK